MVNLLLLPEITQEIYEKDPLFWENTILLENDCLIPTTTNATKGGYKIIRRRSFYNDKSIGAHRHSFSLVHSDFNPLEDESFICHKCDNPPCSRPTHLFLGDQSINFQDQMKKGRSVMQKLNPEIVKSIRFDKAAGMKTKDISKKYLVHMSCIDKVTSRRSWWYV